MRPYAIEHGPRYVRRPEGVSRHAWPDKPFKKSVRRENHNEVVLALEDREHFDYEDCDSECSCCRCLDCDICGSQFCEHDYPNDAYRHGLSPRPLLLNLFQVFAAVR